MSMRRLFKSTLLIKIVELWCKSYGWWCQHYSPDDAVAHLQIVHPLLSLAYPLWQFNEQNIGYREHNRNPSQTAGINNNNDTKLTLPAMAIYIERRRRWLSHGRFCKWLTECNVTETLQLFQMLNPNSCSNCKTLIEFEVRPIYINFGFSVVVVLLAM